MRGTVRSVDPVLLALIFGLVVFGVVMLVSATGPLGFERFGDTYYFVKHQLLFGILPGLVLMAVLSRVPSTFCRKIAGMLLIVSVALLVLVFIPGVGADFGTSQSWISVAGFRLQPAEIVKLTFLLYLAPRFETRAGMAL